MTPRLTENKGPKPPGIFDPKFKLLASRPKPEFMLIGGAKCGTTSFSTYLPAHPQVEECRIKEPNFWSWQLCSRSEYQDLFVNPEPLLNPAAGQLIGGEYSTSSLIHPLVPRRVRARLPNVKLIVLLRNPVDRAYSHYIMSQRQGMEPHKSFEEIVRQEIKEVPDLLAAHQRGFSDPDYRTSAHRSLPDGTPLRVAEHNHGWPMHPLRSDEELFRFYGTSYVFRSLYHDQLWRWMQLFPRERFKIIQAETLFGDRAAVMNDVVSFLNLQPYEFQPGDLEHSWGGGASNYQEPGDYAAMSPDTRRYLEGYFEPFNEQLFELIGDRYDWY
jgi:hypothetical protein